MKNKWLSFFAIIALIFLGTFSISEAHEIQTSGSIIVVLHIEPADDPGVNEVSRLIFYFTDKDSKLDLLKCDCTLKISQNSNLLLDENLKDDKKANISETQLSIPFIFPSKGNYEIEIEGKAIQPNSFQSFDESFNIKVERDNGAHIPLYKRIINNHFLHQSHLLHILLFGTAIVISLVVIIRSKKEE